MEDGKEFDIIMASRRRRMVTISIKGRGRRNLLRKEREMRTILLGVSN